MLIHYNIIFILKCDERLCKLPITTWLMSRRVSGHDFRPPRAGVAPTLTVCRAVCRKSAPHTTGVSLPSLQRHVWTSKLRTEACTAETSHVKTQGNPHRQTTHPRPVKVDVKC